METTSPRSYTDLPIDTILIILKFANVNGHVQAKSCLNLYGYFEKDCTRTIQRIFNFYFLDAAYSKYFAGAEYCKVPYTPHVKDEKIVQIAQCVQKVVCECGRWIRGPNQLQKLNDCSWPKNVSFILSPDDFSEFADILCHWRTERVEFQISPLGLKTEYYDIIMNALNCDKVKQAAHKFRFEMYYLLPGRFDPLMTCCTPEFWQVVGPYVNKVSSFQDDYGWFETWDKDFITRIMLPSVLGNGKKKIQLEMDFVMSMQRRGLWHLLDVQTVYIGGSYSKYDITNYDTSSFLVDIAHNAKVNKIVVDYKHMNIPKLNVNGVIFESIDFRRDAQQRWKCTRYEVKKGWDSERHVFADKYDAAEVQHAVDFLETVMN